MAKPGNEPNFHRLITLNLLPESYAEFLRRSSNLFDEMVRLSEREELQQRSTDLRKMSAVIAIVGNGVLDG